jgi:MFS transporter, DHA1 family, solute carrier family 18 (vesicular amine transporter), member 1/2
VQSGAVQRVGPDSVSGEAEVGRLRAGRWAALVAVGFAVFTDYLIYGAIVPLTPYSPAAGGPVSHLSILYGAYSVGVLLSTPPFGIIGDRFSYRAVMWLAAGLSVPGILLLWHTDGFALTLIGRLFQGAASAATWTAGLALVASHYPEQRVRMIGFTLMASTGGSVIGPVMSGVLYQYGGYGLPFAVLCGFAVVDAGLRFLLLPPDKAHEGGRLGLTGLLADRSVAAPALAVAIAAGAWGILEPVLPHHLGLTLAAGAAEVGLLFTLATIMYGFATPLVSFATERFGVTPTIVAGIVVMAASLPLLGLTPNLILTGVVLCVVNAAFAFLLNPTSAELGDAVERRGLACYGAVYAIYNIAYAVGMMSASTLSASLADRFGVGQILLCVSAILLVCIPLIVGASSRAQTVSAAAQEPPGEPS